MEPLLVEKDPQRINLSSDSEEYEDVPSRAEIMRSNTPFIERASSNEELLPRWPSLSPTPREKVSTQRDRERERPRDSLDQEQANKIMEERERARLPAEREKKIMERAALEREIAEDPFGDLFYLSEKEVIKLLYERIDLLIVALEQCGHESSANLAYAEKWRAVYKEVLATENVELNDARAKGTGLLRLLRELEVENVELNDALRGHSAREETLLGRVDELEKENVETYSREARLLRLLRECDADLTASRRREPVFATRQGETDDEVPIEFLNI